MHRVQEKHFPPMKGNCKSDRCSTVKVPDFKHLKAVVIWLRVFTFQHVDITVVTESERWDHRFPIPKQCCSSPSFSFNRK